MLDHYLHTAHAAEALLEPQQSWYSLGEPARGVTIGCFADRYAAKQWFDQEHLALMAVLRLAAGLGFELHACLLPETLTGVLDQSGRWEDLAASAMIAIEAAQRCGHPDAGVYALRGLAAASVRQGRLDEGYDHLQRGLEQFTELKNLDGQGRVHLNLACLVHFMGDDEAAINHAHRALELFELLDEKRAGLAASLNTVGWFEAQRGNTEAGLTYCERALAIAQEIDNQKTAAATWDSLGYVRQLLGQHETAVRCYEQAAAIYADLGAVWYRAEVLTNLGEAHEANGERQVARDLWREALEVFELTQHPQAATLRVRVQDSPSWPCPVPQGGHDHGDLPGCPPKIHTIKKTVRLYPIFSGEFSPGDEFSVYMTAKSPSSEISPRSCPSGPAEQERPPRYNRIGALLRPSRN